MAQVPQLVWSNPHATPHFTITARMLANLSEALIDRVKRGQFQAARGLVSLYALSPIAIGVVAGQMSRAGIPEEIVLSIV